MYEEDESKKYAPLQNEPSVDMPMASDQMQSTALPNINQGSNKGQFDTDDRQTEKISEKMADDVSLEDSNESQT